MLALNESKESKQNECLSCLQKFEFVKFTFWILYFLVPERPPEGISCEGITSAGIELKWNLLPSEMLRGKLTSYKIFYQEVSSLNLKDSSNGGVEQIAPSALKVINSKATFILKGLQPLSNYSVMLGAQTILGDGPLSLPIFCLTKPSGTKVKPSNKQRLYHFSSFIFQCLEVLNSSKLHPNLTILW